MTVDPALVRAREFLAPFIGARIEVDDATFDDFCKRLLDGMRVELQKLQAEDNAA